MTNILTHFSKCNPSAVSCYIDTLELFFRFPPKGIGKLRALQGLIPQLIPCRDRNGFNWGFRLVVHQPKRATIQELSKLQKKYKAKLCRLDVAADFILLDSEACQTFRSWFEKSALLKRRRVGSMVDEENTTYWISHRERARLGKKRRRDLALYGDKPCKLTGEMDCVHVELRLMCTDAVRKAGFHYARDVINVDPSRLFKNHIKLVIFDPQPAKQRLMRSMVDRDRRQCRGKTLSEFTDRFRASLPQRARGWIDRFKNRAQLLKDFMGVDFMDAEMKPVDIGMLCLPNHLEWPQTHDNINNHPIPKNNYANSMRRHRR